jgi:hypothetical protein
MNPINCQFWIDQGSDHAGKCSLGLFGGMPARAVCGACLRHGGPTQRQILNPITEQPVRKSGGGNGCSGCGRAKIQTWMGMRWHGTPWPKRWKIWGGWICYIPEKGCGCLVKPKAFVTGLKLLVRTVRAA